MVDKKSKNKKTGVIVTIAVIIGLLFGAGLIGRGVQINIEKNGEGYKAELVMSDTAQTPELTEGLDGIEYGQGEVKADGETIPTVEEVDANGPQVNPEDEEPVDCPEGEECGRGAAYPYVDTSTPQAFINATLGGCYNIDGYFDEQCWDYAALFFLNYAGHTFYTCGTGAAKGAIADGCWQKNAGSDFTMVWNAKDLQPGDIVVFNNGTWGHVGMATGYYNNGYITLAGQNQGGGLCPGSKMGARVNIINISLSHFAGAFRPNSYIQPEPEPEPKPESTPVANKCEKWTLKWGDTLGQIMKECEGKVQWGDAMDNYAKSWVDEQTGVAVFDGWRSNNGIGLYAGHTIVRK